MGRPTQAERNVIAELASEMPEPATEKQRAKEHEALSTLMRRDPATVKGWIADARAELQQRASRYGEIHMQAVENALAGGENDIASRESRAMLEKIADDEGKRVIDSERGAQSGNGLTIQFGIKLGGVQPGAELPIIETEPEAGAKVAREG